MMLLDYSAGKISGAAIKAAGYDGAIRYITDRNSLGTKHTSPAEYSDHVANGLQDWLVYEVNTNDPLSGFNGGVTAAQRALDGANYVGYPSDRHIFFCFDRHALASELPPWQAYLDGAASVLGVGRVGAYGFSEAIDAANGHATAFWQCGSRTVVRACTNFYQRNTGTAVVGGITCDINDVLLTLEYNDMTVDELVNAVIGHRADGSSVTLGDALVNLYLGAYQGGGDAGPGPVFPAANNAAIASGDASSKLDTVHLLVNALGDKLATFSTPTIDMDALAAKVAPLVSGGIADAVVAAFKAHPLTPQ